MKKLEIIEIKGPLAVDQVSVPSNEGGISYAFNQKKVKSFEVKTITTIMNPVDIIEQKGPLAQDQVSVPSNEGGISHAFNQKKVKAPKEHRWRVKGDKKPKMLTHPSGMSPQERAEEKKLAREETKLKPIARPDGRVGLMPFFDCGEYKRCSVDHELQAEQEKERVAREVRFASFEKVHFQYSVDEGSSATLSVKALANNNRLKPTYAKQRTSAPRGVPQFKRPAFQPVKTSATIMSYEEASSAICAVMGLEPSTPIDEVSKKAGVKKEVGVLSLSAILKADKAEDRLCKRWATSLYSPDPNPVSADNDWYMSEGEGEQDKNEDESDDWSDAEGESIVPAGVTTVLKEEEEDEDDKQMLGSESKSELGGESEHEASGTEMHAGENSPDGAGTVLTHTETGQIDKPTALIKMTEIGSEPKLGGETKQEDDVVSTASHGGQAAVRTAIKDAESVDLKKVTEVGDAPSKTVAAAVAVPTPGGAVPGVGSIVDMSTGYIVPGFEPEPESEQEADPECDDVVTDEELGKHTLTVEHEDEDDPKSEPVKEEYAIDWLDAWKKTSGESDAAQVVRALAESLDRYKAENEARHQATINFVSTSLVEIKESIRGIKKSLEKVESQTITNIASINAMGTRFSELSASTTRRIEASEDVNRRRLDEVVGELSSINSSITKIKATNEAAQTSITDISYKVGVIEATVSKAEVKVKDAAPKTKAAAAQADAEACAATSEVITVEVAETDKSNTVLTTNGTMIRFNFQMSEEPHVLEALSNSGKAVPPSIGYKLQEYEGKLTWIPYKKPIVVWVYNKTWSKEEFPCGTTEAKVLTVLLSRGGIWDRGEAPDDSSPYKGFIKLERSARDCMKHRESIVNDIIKYADPTKIKVQPEPTSTNYQEASLMVYEKRDVLTSKPLYKEGDSDANKIASATKMFNAVLEILLRSENESSLERLVMKQVAKTVPQASIDFCLDIVVGVAACGGSTLFPGDYVSMLTRAEMTANVMGKVQNHDVGQSCYIFTKQFIENRFGEIEVIASDWLDNKAALIKSKKEGAARQRSSSVPKSRPVSDEPSVRFVKMNTGNWVQRESQTQRKTVVSGDYRSPSLDQAAKAVQAKRLESVRDSADKRLKRNLKQAV